jgi:predicted DNA-binding transcriptional regulator AlpA
MPQLEAQLKRTTAPVKPVSLDCQSDKPETQRKRPRAPRPRRTSADRAASSDPDAGSNSGDDDGEGGDDDGDGDPDPAPPRGQTIVGGRVLVDYEGLRELGLTYTKVRIWQLMRIGGFPKSVSFGRQKPFWVLAEVEAWIEARFNARFAGTDQQNHAA